MTNKLLPTKLTQERIRKCNCPSDKQQIFLWDTNVKGLGVRITQTSKVYVFQDKLDGKTIRLKIGDTKTWPADSSNPKQPGARQEASRLKNLIDKGVDPRVEKKEREALQQAKQTEEDRQAITVEKAWKAYIQERKPSWSERHYNDHLKLTHAGGVKKKRGKGKTIPAVLSSFMPVKLSDLTQSFIKKWVTREQKKRPGQTRLAFSLLRAFVNWCENKTEYKDLADPLSFTGAFKKDNLPKQKPKIDSLQREQLPSWFASVKKIQNPVISSYLQILLLIGARREELLNLKWKDVEFTWGHMTLRDKVEGERIIPLTPYVLYLLQLLPKRNRWVFSSPTAESGRLQEPRKAHNLALTDAGIPHLSIHGLRRSFSNLAEWVEVPIGVVYQIMGHKPSATAEKHYKNRPIDLLRKWHSEIEKWILNEAGIQAESYTQDQQKLRMVNGGKQ